MPVVGRRVCGHPGWGRGQLCSLDTEGHTPLIGRGDRSVEVWAGKAGWRRGAFGGSETSTLGPGRAHALESMPRRPLPDGRPPWGTRWHWGSSSLCCLLPHWPLYQDLRIAETL